MSRGALVVSCVFAILLLLILTTPSANGGLVGTSVSADMQGLAGTGGVITQFTSPQTVVDPGVEFTGTFTPNAGGYPLAIELTNAMGMSVDISAMSLRVMMQNGSITGAHINFGPTIRVEVTNLSFPSAPPGTSLTGITQTDGPAPYDVLVTSPTSLAIDFNDFSERTMDFDLVTSTVPEPALALVVLFALVLASAGLPRRRIRVAVPDGNI